ncbi:MAG: coenzyme F420-0:L-glutamate ligase [Armatimonadetes bacterium]|nr:coenzyme F420-0:L-glutamate ligase [Armatimonadota bacterium]
MAILAVLAVLLILAASLELVALRVGDCKIRLGLDRVEDAAIRYPDAQHACLRFRLPFRNLGRQQGLLIDARALMQPAGHRYSELQPVCRLINPGAPRTDGYWEAFIVPAGQEQMVEVELWLTSDSIRGAIVELGVLRIDFYYKYYGRTPLHSMREELVLPMSDFREVQEELEYEFPAETPAASDPEAAVLPLRTHLMRPGEDIVEICARYVEGLGNPGDILALAETAVAITQGRVIYCEDIHPGYLASRLNKLFGMHSSMSSVYALEMAIREVGLPRVLMATVAGLVGRVAGRQGDFYRIAGRAVAAIDDCTGTLPPFDKHIVMGPARGDELVQEIRQRTGLEATIVDANDLGKVDVLHISDTARTAEVVEALRPNPQGNAGEMTPLVLIRKTRPASPPVVESPQNSEVES